MRFGVKESAMLLGSAAAVAVSFSAILAAPITSAASRESGADVFLQAELAAIGGAGLYRRDAAATDPPSTADVHASPTAEVPHRRSESRPRGSTHGRQRKHVVYPVPNTRKTPERPPFVRFTGPDPACDAIINSDDGAPLPEKWRRREGLAECRHASARLHELCQHGIALPLANASRSETFWFEAHEALTLGHVLQLLPLAHSGGGEKPPLFLDIGMNLGVFAMFAAAANPRLDVWAYEPQPACVDLARCSAAAVGAADRVTVHNAYVGSGRGTAPVRVTGCDPSHSLTNAAAADGATVQVPFVDVAAAAKGRKIAGVKIDVEGAELGVLEQLAPLLDGDGAPGFVLAELSPMWWQQRNASRCRSMVGEFFRRGYRMYWYRVFEWIMRILPPKAPYVPPWKRIGTRYGQTIHPLVDPVGACARAQQEGRVDVLFVRADLENRTAAAYCNDCFGCQVNLPQPDGSKRQIDFNETRMLYCTNAVMHDGWSCGTCGPVRRKDARAASRSAVWMKYQQVPKESRFLPDAYGWTPRGWAPTTPAPA
eukprot:TRINITY_DN15778_c0_g1_i1.p2 TRINITY_DN15778_c0_g1~~TRINITY_DN15778_c0_g1_i1.p2  ORF type:complete len:541 (+),score=198.71 TRINITY_DN15778_c0_g1_i1:56-1678(+)